MILMFPLLIFHLKILQQFLFLNVISTILLIPLVINSFILILMSTIKPFDIFDILHYNNINLDILTETVIL